jgi:hypothetical protein
MGIRYPPVTRPDGARYGDAFLLAGDTHTRLEPRHVWDGYFFPPVGNPTDTRYFTTTMIVDCEQVKICLFVILTMTCFDC